MLTVWAYPDATWNVRRRLSGRKETSMKQVVGKAVVPVLLLVFIPGSALSQSTNPLIGTWKFSPEKSKLMFTLTPQNLVRTYVDRGGGVYIFTQDGREVDGSRVFSMYVARDDGAEYPLVVRGEDELGVISIKAVDTYTAQQTQKVGNATTTATRMLSRDGKMLTITVRPPGAPAGEGNVDIYVFDKQ
jgi:hypothetical protein